MAEEAVETKANKSNKLIIILVVVAVLLLGVVGAGVAWFLLSGSSDEDNVVAELQDAAKKEAIYVKLRTSGGKPYFIANFAGEQASTQRFMQIYAEARTRDTEVQEALMHHMPLIVHSLSSLFSSQKLSDMQTAEGKERLRMQATDKIKEIMQQEIGRPGIEEVYFTNFVMQ